MPPVRIVCISDTHGQHAKLSVPAGDVLIHAGDFMALGVGQKRPLRVTSKPATLGG
jgi:predicted phosphodiesterase